ncbi:MAG TPA: hypothetical protein DDW67_05620 [Elusimicrobia bacterium]|jgi:hypothetical protein|nr:hypothetical protein [Elusimicrobiota bacterium]
MSAITGPGLILTLLLLTAAAPDCFSQVQWTQNKTIYGPDGRLDFYQVSDPVEKAALGSAVSMFRLNAGLLPDGGYYRLTGRTLGDTYSGLCPGEPFYDQPVGAVCSGTLIAPDLVLTAGHCMAENPGLPDKCAATRFAFGFSLAAPGAPLRLIPAEEVYSCKEKVLYSYSGGRDYAVIRLDRPVSGHEPAALQFSLPAPGAPIFSIGGPYGLPLKVLEGATVRRTYDDGQFILTDIDSSGGNSGGGIFSAESGRLMAVHVHSNDPDLIRIPLPAGHGLPPEDHRVRDGHCLTAARYGTAQGNGKRAVLLKAVPGLAALLSGEKTVELDPELSDFDPIPQAEQVFNAQRLFH